MARGDEQLIVAEGVGEILLRRSTRAKRILFKVAQNGEVTIVLPWAADISRLPELIRCKQHWIENVRRRLMAQREKLGEVGQAIPARVDLKALQQSWTVSYQPAAGHSVRLREASGQLNIVGAVENAEAVGRVLRSWAANLGRKKLPAWAFRLAREQGVAPAKISIRGQKTRWGSCSSKGGLSLNWKLLFLQPELCRYVLLHELAHLEHLNHSKAYWKLLTSWEPQARELDRALRDAWTLTPVWANT